MNPTQTNGNGLPPYATTADNRFNTISPEMTGNTNLYNSQPAPIPNYQVLTAPNTNLYDSDSNSPATEDFDQSQNTPNNKMQQQQQLAAQMQQQQQLAAQMQQQQQLQQMQQQQQLQQMQQQQYLQQMQYNYGTMGNGNGYWPPHNNNNIVGGPQLTVIPSQSYVPEVLVIEIRNAIYDNIPPPYMSLNSITQYYHQILSVVESYYQNQVRRITKVPTLLLKMCKCKVSTV